jgi:hypothetical protein
MFILIINQELCAREVMGRIMDCDNSLGLKGFLNQLNLLFICNKSRIMDMRSNGLHYGLRSLSRPEGYT